jgi:predicted nucleic acid-binding protein
MPVNDPAVILDACCVLNFSASGNLVPILQSLPAQVVVTQVVRERELLSLQRMSDANHDAANQFDAAIDQGLLLVEDFANDREAESFVNYASVLGDDGESATCAIAVHREWAIATDDRQAISFFQREAPHLQILSTLEIIKHWSEVTTVTSAELRSALLNIRTRGRYVPHRNHPLLSWWQDAMK